MDPYLKNLSDRLNAVTDGCRSDMHEPDEQGLKCRIVGDHLDNACGDDIRVEAVINGYQEYVVVLERFLDNKIVVERFNLASLIAVARLAQRGEGK